MAGVVTARGLGGACGECCWDLEEHQVADPPRRSCRLCDEPATEGRGAGIEDPGQGTRLPQDMSREGSHDLAERDLVELAKGLDQDALTALFNSYYPRIYRYGLVQLRNVHAAEDFASDVMLNMLDGLRRFEFRGRPFSAWVFRIARNKLIDMQRRRKRCSEYPLVEGVQYPRGTGNGHIAQLLDVQEIQTALGHLTDGQAQVIVLRFLHDLDVPTVARILGRKERAIKSLQFRALVSIRQVLQGWDVKSGAISPRRDVPIPVTPLQ